MFVFLFVLLFACGQDDSASALSDAEAAAAFAAKSPAVVGIPMFLGEDASLELVLTEDGRYWCYQTGKTAHWVDQCTPDQAAQRADVLESLYRR